MTRDRTKPGISQQAAEILGPADESDEFHGLEPDVCDPAQRATGIRVELPPHRVELK